MRYLSDVVSVEHRNVRSVNIEGELESASPLAGFVATDQVVDVVRRLVEALATGPRARAWSITGPYGAGKSSLAHFICALLSHDGDATRSEADRILRRSSPSLAKDLDGVRPQGAPTTRGFVRAAATAGREPITATVTRALHRGAEAHRLGRGRRSDLVNELHAATVRIQRGDFPDPQFVLQMIDALARKAPVVIVLDELGKALEFAADRSRESDLYLLQQIAERFSSDEQPSGAIFALQHLAFEDYATSLSAARRLEWRKIQGRFEDVAFAGGPSHSAALIGDSLRMSRAPSSVAKAVKRAREELAKVVPDMRPLLDALGNPPAGYPLHPTTLPAMVELAGRFGQHDRSLMAFLTSDAPEALPDFLKRQALEERVPFLRLPEIYDYFAEGAAALDFAGEDAARLREIRGSITEARDLAPLERDCLKAVGVLNLAAHGGYRASHDVLRQALAGPMASAEHLQSIDEALELLQQRRLLTYREFADEYRVWQGSDFDVPGAIAERREALAQDVTLHGPPVEHLTEVRPPRAIVARRHSQRYEVLRYFETRYVSEVGESVSCVRDDADGVLLFVLAGDEVVKKFPTVTPDGRPVVAVVSRHVKDLTEAAIDAMAAKQVLAATNDLDDVVARREIRHRAAIAQRALGERFDAAFDLSRDGVSCIAGGRRTKVQRPQQLSELLSDLCDEIYGLSPVIRNEMLNRRELTSQGAKSRRELLERMFLVGNRPGLEIEGFGPDRAMYEAVLASTGLHAERNDVASFGEPSPDSGLQTAWEAINAFFDEAVTVSAGIDELYGRLQRPPYGMKEGPIPVLLAAALLHRSDDVFVFEEGTFLPRVGPEHFERLVKTPGRFTVKRASLLGMRAEVFRDLATLLGNAPLPANLRNGTTLGVVRPLILLAQALPEYSRRTSSLSATAVGVRHALTATREPDELLFSALPRACGFDALAPGTAGSVANSFVPTLQGALDELTGAYENLLDRVRASLRRAFDTRGREDDVRIMREELRSRSRHLLEHVIDRRLRSFLLMATNEDFGDREWLEALATVLAQKPPSGWTDADVPVFDSNVLEIARAFRRVELLHMQMARLGDESFEAHRVTLTRSDGSEVSDVVLLERSRRRALEQLVDETVNEARRLGGNRAQQGLLALLADRVLTDEVGTKDDSVSNSSRRGKADIA